MNIHRLNPWESSGSEQPIQWRSWTFVWNIHSWLGRPRARSAMAPWLWCIPLLLATSLVVVVAARLLPQNPWKRGRIDHYFWNSSRTDLFCIFFFGVAKSQISKTEENWCTARLHSVISPGLRAYQSLRRWQRKQARLDAINGEYDTWRSILLHHTFFVIFWDSIEADGKVEHESSLVDIHFSMLSHDRD